MGGIRLDGLNTEENFVGKAYHFVPFIATNLLPSLVYNNTGHGIHLSNGASRNTIELLNVAGNGLVNGTPVTVADGVRD